MASSRDILRRIKSVSNIGKVTRAMEAVSASKMRRAQAATLASRAYARKAAQVMAYLRAQPGGSEILHPLLQDHPAGRPAVVLISTIPSTRATPDPWLASHHASASIPPKLWATTILGRVAQACSSPSRPLKKSA